MDGPLTPNATAAIAATIGIDERGAANLHVTTFNLAATPITIVGATGVGFGSVQLGTFPQGRILVLGVTASLAFPLISTEGDLTNASDGHFGIGTISCTDGDLTDAADVSFLPRTATTADDLTTAVGAALAASAQFDGTTTAVPIILNGTITDAHTDETSIIGATGNVTITWVNLGDY
jgi:hypothetical protein